MTEQQDIEKHTHDGIVNDSLENAVTKLSKLCGLTSVASEVEIKNQIVIYEKEIHSEKMILTQNVPVKALSGFANKGTETRKLWECIMEIRPIIDIFDDTTVKKDAYDVDHFIPRSFVMNDELWNLCPMDSSLNSAKNNRLPYWDPFFGKFADNQYVLYELLNEYDHVNKLFKNCYKDNLHSIWANGELYRRGNSKSEFCKILEKNMQPLFDSAHRQGYEMWNRKKVG